MTSPKPHSRDLRAGRHSEAGHTYLITAITWKRQAFFADLMLGRLVVNTLRHQQQAGHVDSLAYVLMPDHLHWLITLHDTTTLARLMHSIKSYSAQRINQALRHRGEPIPNGRPVWQSGYHDHALRKEEDLLQVARYVVANPLRAKLVEKLGDYPLWDAKWV